MIDAIELIFIYHINIMTSATNIVCLLIIIMMILYYLFLTEYHSSIKCIIADHSYNKMLLDHEKRKEYPMKIEGNDITTNHGSDYFKFFDRLGETRVVSCILNNKIVASACSVLRDINDTKVWYLNNLRVEDEYKGLNLPYRMFKHGFIYSLRKSSQCYYIDTGKEDTKHIKKIEVSSYFRFKESGRLYIYIFDYDFMLNMHISLDGIQNYNSDENKLNILHLQWGSYGKHTGENVYKYPQKNYKHMFCIHENNKLKNILDKLEIEPNNVYNIVQYGMNRTDWDFILTSDFC